MRKIIGMDDSISSAIFEAFKVNSISVSGNDYQSIVFLICSYPSSNEIRLKFLKSGFFYAGLYCIWSFYQTILLEQILKMSAG